MQLYNCFCYIFVIYFQIKKLPYQCFHIILELCLYLVIIFLILLGPNTLEIESLIGWK